MLAVLLGLVIVLCTLRDASAVEVAYCGFWVPDGEVGILVNDLDCVGVGEAAVHVGNDATLQMNGHRVSGSAGATASSGIDCRGDTCTVIGPGEIEGFADPWYGWGVGGTPKSVVLSNLDIHHNYRGVFFYNHRTKATVTNVIVRDNEADGMWVAKLRATNLVATGNGRMGIFMSRMDGRDVLQRSTVVGTAVVASDNGQDGVFAGRVVIDGLTTERNGGFGLNARSVRLTGSTLTGNSLALPPSAPLRDLDLVAARRPALKTTTCGRSVRDVGGTLVGDWDVCSGD